MARAWLKGRPRLRGALRLLLIGLVLWLVLTGGRLPGPVGIASLALALWAGLVPAFAGAALGLTQQRAKSVLAYSTIS